MTTASTEAAEAASPKDDPTIWRVDDTLWAEIAPLLVIDKPRKKPGRPRHDDRRILDGLIWLARTGSQWAALPAEFGPKSTAHARFQEWVQAGIFEQAWATVLTVYNQQVGVDWTWQAADGCMVKAPLGKKGLPERRKRPGATPPTGPNAESSGIS